MFWVCFFEGVEAVDAPCVLVAQEVFIVPADHLADVVVVVSWVHHVCVVLDADNVSTESDCLAHASSLLVVLFDPPDRSLWHRAVCSSIY